MVGENGLAGGQVYLCLLVKLLHSCILEVVNHTESGRQKLVLVFLFLDGLGLLRQEVAHTLHYLNYSQVGDPRSEFELDCILNEQQSEPQPVGTDLLIEADQVAVYGFEQRKLYFGVNRSDEFDVQEPYHEFVCCLELSTVGRAKL